MSGLALALAFVVVVGIVLVLVLPYSLVDSLAFSTLVLASPCSLWLVGVHASVRPFVGVLDGVGVGVGVGIFVVCWCWGCRVRCPIRWRSSWCSLVRCCTQWRRRRCWRVRLSRWHCPGAGNGSFVGVFVGIVGGIAGAAGVRPLVVVWLAGSQSGGVAGVLLLLLRTSRCCGWAMVLLSSHGARLCCN